MSRRTSSPRVLGANPNWEQIRKQAKGLLREAQNAGPAALAELIEYVPRLSGQSAATLDTSKLGLNDAQLALARAYGFASWPKLKCHVEMLVREPLRDIDLDMGSMSDHEIKTRVTTLDEMKVERVGDDCLVVIYAKEESELGTRHVLRNGTSIGRTAENDIMLDVDSVSRRHARVEQRGQHFFLLDLRSTNGTYLNDDPEPIASTQLRRGDQVKIGSTIFKYLSGTDVEAQYHEAIFNMTIKDGLTNLSNRKQLDLVLTKEIPRAQRHRRALTMVMIDIDHFKAINDTQGHVGGDTILHDLAGLMRQRLRPDDELGRYGGEEFCAILPETEMREAVVISEQLRSLVEGHRFVVEGEEVRVTISLGVAELGAEMEMLDLYRAADAQLYEAKRRGRNRVCAGL